MEQDRPDMAHGWGRGGIVWDNHACMPLRPDDTRFLPELDRYRRAGVTMVSLNVGFGTQTLDEHVRMLAAFRHWITRHADRFRLVSTIADIHHARQAGQLGICFDIEGMTPLDRGDHGLVALFHDLGVRWMLVAYNQANLAGAGCYDPMDGGLTAHGRALLAEMRRVGMVVCCSHTGERTALDVMDQARNPVILSHSNARALYDHPRNVSDGLIRACAATGGVIGVNGLGPLLGTGSDLVTMMVHHIDHIAQLVGPAHVGLGLDHVFDRQELDEYLAAMQAGTAGFKAPPPGFPMLGPEGVPVLASALADRGYPDDAIAGILGGNFLRVAEAVWGGAT